MMFGVPNLTEDMVRMAVPFLSEACAEEIREAERHGQQAWLAAVNKYKVPLCNALGVTPETGTNYNWRDEFNGLLSAFAKTGSWAGFDTLVAAGNWDDVYAAVVNAPTSLWEYLNQRVNAGEKLSTLNNTLGACTPRLCKLLMDAPKDIPMTLFLAHACDIHVDEVPDVPLSFMDDFPELADAEDYANAFMKAYIISCLKLFFDEGTVMKHVSKYTVPELRRWFPRIAWEVSGHSFYDNEVVLFDTVTSW